MSLARMLPATFVALLAIALLPSGAAARKIFVNVTWEGHGTMKRSYHQVADGGGCSVETHAYDESSFRWKAQWKRVPMDLAKKTDAVTKNQSRDLDPHASLNGTYHVNSGRTNGCATPPIQEACDKTIKFGTRDNPTDQTLLISRMKSKPRYEFFFDAQSGLTGDSYDCADTPFGGEFGGYIWDNYQVDPPSPINLGALSAYTYIPISVLAGNGKVIDNVTSKQMHVPPGENYDCAKDGFGQTCKVTQKWLGHFTIQRVG